MKELDNTVELKLESLNTLSVVYQRLSSVAHQAAIDSTDHVVFMQLLDKISALVKDIKTS